MARTLLLIVAVAVGAIALGCDLPTIGQHVFHGVLSVVSKVKYLQAAVFGSNHILTPQMEALCSVMKVATSTRESDVHKARATDKALAFVFPAVVPGTKISEEKVGNATAFIVTAPAVQDGVILYFHMGAYVYFDAQTFLGLGSMYSRSARAHVVALDYSKGPEHPMPAAVDDAFAAYKWLIEGKGPLGKVSPKKIVLMGESAGGGLSLLLLQRLQKAGLPLPAGAAMSSPWVDISCDYPSVKGNANIDAMITPYFLCEHASPLAFGANTNVRDATFSPIAGSFRGLPPLMFTVGDGEMLRDSVVAAAKKARKEGVKTYLEVEPNPLHCYQFGTDYAPETREALGRYTGFARMLISQAEE